MLPFCRGPTLILVAPTPAANSHAPERRQDCGAFGRECPRRKLVFDAITCGASQCEAPALPVGMVISNRTPNGFPSSPLMQRVLSVRTSYACFRRRLTPCRPALTELGIGSASQYVSSCCLVPWLIRLRVTPIVPLVCGMVFRQGASHHAVASPEQGSSLFCAESCNTRAGPPAYAQTLSLLQSWSQSEHVGPFGFGEALAPPSCSPLLRPEQRWTCPAAPAALHPPLFICTPRHPCSPNAPRQTRVTIDSIS